MPAARRGAITGATASLPSPAPAPSMSSGFSFGAPPAAPAPSGGSGGFSFGSAPAPGGGLFGSSPAPSSGSGGFSFGSAPAPGPASGGLFGSTPSSAPASGGLFGSAPAPASGGLFGSTPAPANNNNGGGGLFGSTPGQAQTLGPPPDIAGNMPYQNLPPAYKQAIDTLHQAVMQHRRATMMVSTMAPRLLSESPPSQADAAAGSLTRPSKHSSSLKQQAQRLKTRVVALDREMTTLREMADACRNNNNKITTQAVMYGKWPTEAVAMRRGVSLSYKKKKAKENTPPATATSTSSSSSEQVTSPSQTEAKIRQQLQDLLDRQLPYIDRIERMPSPFLFDALEDFEKRLVQIAARVQAVDQQIQAQLAAATRSSEVNVTAVVQAQNDAIMRLAAAISNVHYQIDIVRQRYAQYETGINVIEEANQLEIARRHNIDKELRLTMIKELPQPKAPAQAPATGFGGFGNSAPAPSSGGLFGNSSTSLFGSSTPAPAPSGGSLFGSAPASGSLFGGSTPAPAPGGGGLFGGSTPAPAPSGGGGGGGLFGGSTPAPAPSGGGGLFGGSTPAPAPTPAGGGLFGLNPAPAPAGGGLFGGSTPAPAPAFGAAPAPGAFSFGGGASSTSSSTSASSKSRSKSRSSRRR